MPFTFNPPNFLSDHVKKVLELEKELMKHPDFSSEMILDYHLQLIAIVIVAACEYNPTVTYGFFHTIGHNLGDLVAEKLKSKPQEFIPQDKQVVH